MGTLAHTPYDGTSKPFTIGLRPLDPARWIEVDENLPAYLAEKQRLYAERPGDVLMAQADTIASQREVLNALADFLPARFPDIYRRDGNRIAILSTESSVDPDTFPQTPLRTASLLVQEDLVLMRKGDNGWRLAAASLCFPSSWSLVEKFGRPLADIHASVPDFGRGTRPAELIERMFDGLQGQMVERMNWSLTIDPSLYLPLSEVERKDRVDDGRPRFPGDDPSASAFIRVERQTLRKMPVSGDILFTIRIHVDPLRALAQHPDRAALAASFAAQLDALDAAQLGYKGLHNDRDQLVKALRRLGDA